MGSLACELVSRCIVRTGDELEKLQRDAVCLVVVELVEDHECHWSSEVVSLSCC